MKAIHLSVAIISTPARAHLHEYVLSKIPQAKFFVDADHRGVWWNAKRAWQAIDEGATHQLLLEDDVLFCEDFLKHAKRFLTYFRHDPVSFFHLEDAPEKSVVRTFARVSGQALCLPVELVLEFLSWEESNLRPQHDLHDARFAMWLAATGKFAHCPNPAMVDHRLEESCYLPGTVRANLVAKRLGVPDLSGALDYFTLDEDREAFLVSRQKHFLRAANGQSNR